MEAKKVNDYEIAEPLELSEIPEPPPMTRELLYRAVFNEVDTANSNNQKDGYITLNKVEQLFFYFCYYSYFIFILACKYFK